MPHIQKLYEGLKERKDIQVVTLNVDDNVGLVEPFLKQNKLTVPVIPAKFLVENLVPVLGIPLTWIVDVNGVIRMEQVGFGPNEKWEELVIEAMEKVRTAGQGQRAAGF